MELHQEELVFMESNIIYSVIEFGTINFISINYSYSRRIYRFVI